MAVSRATMALGVMLAIAVLSAGVAARRNPPPPPPPTVHAAYLASLTSAVSCDPVDLWTLRSLSQAITSSEAVISYFPKCKHTPGLTFGVASELQGSCRLSTTGGRDYFIMFGVPAFCMDKLKTTSTTDVLIQALVKLDGAGNVFVDSVSIIPVVEPQLEVNSKEDDEDKKDSSSSEENKKEDSSSSEYKCEGKDNCNSDKSSDAKKSEDSDVKDRDGQSSSQSDSDSDGDKEPNSFSDSDSDSKYSKGTSADDKDGSSDDKKDDKDESSEDKKDTEEDSSSDTPSSTKSSSIVVSSSGDLANQRDEDSSDSPNPNSE